MSAPAPYLASVPRRIGAAAIDLAPVLLLFIVAQGVVDQFRLEPPATPLAAFLVFVIYHATFQFKWSGETPGCRFLGIRVVSHGEAPDLSLVQCIARPCVKLTWLAAFFPVVMVFGAFWLVIVPAFVDLIMMSSLPSRQTVADLLCRTFVVRTPPLQPHRAPAAPMFSASDSEFGLRPRRVKCEALTPTQVGPNHAFERTRRQQASFGGFVLLSQCLLSPRHWRAAQRSR